MIQNLINKAYDMKPDNLIMDISRTMDATLISMTSPQKVLERGTLLGITPNYEYVVYGGTVPEIKEETSDSTSGKAQDESVSPDEVLQAKGITPCYIVSDTIDFTRETGKVEVGVYTAGEFRKSSVIMAQGYNLTESDLQELRKLGIILK